ncbi:MAG: hypothetical protein U0270_34445 [Labilithrix sp.]
MTEEEKELEMWREEWQSLGGREGMMNELVAQAKRDATRIRRSKLTEVGAGVLACSVGLWFAMGGKPVAIVLCAGLFLFNGIWLTRLFTLRAEEQGTPLDDFVALRRKRLELDLKWNTFARRATIGLGLALVPWAAWMAWTGRAFYAAEPWRAAVGFGGIVVILAGVLYALAEARSKIGTERERFETLVAERTLV